MKEKSAEDNRLKKIAIGTTGAAGIGALGYGVRSAARRVKKSLSAGARQSLIELEAKIDSVLFADEEEETPRPKKKMGTAAKVAIGAGALMAGSAIGSAASVRRAARKKINSPMSRMAKNQANEAAKRMMPAFSAVPEQVIELNAKLDAAINEFRSMDDEEEGPGLGKKLAGAAAVGAAGYGIGKAGGVRAVADKGLQTATNATLAVSRMGGAKKAATGAADAVRSGVMAATHGAGVKGGVAAARKSLLRKGILR